jgi:hypothetical protein
MKTVLSKFLAISGIALLMLASCKKEGALVTSNGGKAGTLATTSTNLVLDKTKLTDTSKVINFSFTQPSYGFSAAVTNTLQIDSAGDNWKKPTSATLSTKANSQGYSTADFNALLLKLNLPADKQSQIQVRVQHVIGPGAAPIYSNVLSLTVTPFNLKSWVYVPGAYEGWANPGPAEDSLYSATSNGIYSGIINFTAGNNQFLITPKKNWDNKYATTDANNITSSTVTYNGPNNFYAPATPGQYWVTLNTNTNTITFAPADYYSIIGDAAPGTAWQTDTDLKYINDGSQTWAATVPFTVGGFKIRKNHDWTTSYGLLATPDGVSLTSSSGGNIPITTAGTYKVTFNITTVDQTATYTLHP